MADQNHNSGHYNSGNHNSGNRNSGNRNSGDCNSGHYNSGHYNSGDCNSGNRNSGHYNSGDCNSGHYNSGFFCTESPTPIFFDKPTTLTWEEARVIVPYIYLPNPTEWIPLADMTDQENSDYPNATHIGGYLKVVNVSLFDVFPKIWKGLDATERERWTSLPNFDADKFLKITGVDVRLPKTHTIVIDGKETKISHELWLALKDLFNEGDEEDAF